MLEGTVDDLYEKFVWEPEQVRLCVLQAATEAACAILAVDQTIRNPKSEQQQAEAAGRLDGSKPPPKMGRGARMPGKMMQGMGGK